MLNHLIRLKQKLSHAVQANNEKLFQGEQFLEAEKASASNFLMPDCKVIVNYYDKEPPYKVEGVLYIQTSLSYRDLISSVCGIDSPIMPYAWNILEDGDGHPNRGERHSGNHAIAYACIHRPYGWEWANKVRTQGVEWVDRLVATQKNLLLDQANHIEDDLMKDLISKDLVLYALKGIAEYSYHGRTDEPFS